MHTKIKKDVLLLQLELVGKVSTKHITLPVLQCVLISTNGNTITLKATNLEIALESKIEVEVIEEGLVAEDCPATACR